jgi:hypothetical protein
LDKSLREVAGTFTALYESITDQSVAERLRACGPWVKALLKQMLAPSAETILPKGLRFVVIDASTVQAPGAKGTDHRLHIAMDLVSLEFIEVLVSDVHTGETLKHFTLGPGDVAVTDRGYAQAQGMHEAVQRGAALLVRLNPFSVVLSDAQGQPLSLVEALKRQKTETIRTLEVVIASADGEAQVRGWVHAYRLNPEQAGRARQKCRQRHKKGTPKADTLYLAGWVVVFTTLPPLVLNAQTIMALYRCRWQVELMFKNWKSLLNLHLLKGTRPERIKCILYGRLITIVMLAMVSSYAVWYVEDYLHKELSIPKLINWLKRKGRFAKAMHVGTLEDLFNNLRRALPKRLCKQKRKRRTSRQLLEDFGYYLDCRRIFIFPTP